jgi:hypothetical protein
MAGFETESLDLEGIVLVLLSGNPLGWTKDRFGWSVYLR